MQIGQAGHARRTQGRNWPRYYFPKDNRSANRGGRPALRIFSCAEARKESSPNRAGYCNPQADQLLTAGIRETDVARAKTTWQQYSEILQRDQPITPIYWSQDLTAAGPTMQGVSTDPRGQLVNVAHWWMGR